MVSELYFAQVNRQETMSKLKELYDKRSVVWGDDKSTWNDFVNNGTLRILSENPVPPEDLPHLKISGLKIAK